ncbi:MAG: nucleotidyltransferase domain-containing protein [Defluviitaleaceae bacterium]|nr:nucleotidyltransferase domain-containing protein [Defluviitaleaceae bacterium]
MRYKFKDKEGFSPPFTYIHPYKQKEVKNIVDKLKGRVEAIIVFGSSVAYHCWTGSDIDLCLIGISPEDIKRGELPNSDVLYYKTKEEFLNNANTDLWTIEKEILEKGVVVWKME